MSTPTEPVSSTQNEAPTAIPFVLPGKFGDDREAAAKEALKMLKDTERLGGSVAFESWAKETEYGNNPSIPLNIEGLESKSDSSAAQETVYAAWVEIKAIFAYTKLDVGVVNPRGKNMHGEGGVFGLGVGYLPSSWAEIQVHGGNNIEYLEGCELRFQVRVLPFFVDIIFSESGIEVASIRMYDIGLIVNIGFEGGFKFKVSS